MGMGSILQKILMHTQRGCWKEVWVHVKRGREELCDVVCSCILPTMLALLLKLFEAAVEAAIEAVEAAVET
jgi:hypothetical protein